MQIDFLLFKSVVVLNPRFSLKTMSIPVNAVLVVISGKS